MSEQTEWLTIEELSAWINVPVGTLRRWRQNKTGPTGTKMGKHLRYRRSDVEEWATDLRAIPRQRSGNEPSKPSGNALAYIFGPPAVGRRRPGTRRRTSAPTSTTQGR